jgi:hypothetical protein
MHKRLVITAIAVSFGAARLASAAAVEFAAAGFDPTAIQSTVDGFRAALGANNGIGGTFPDGRREINWDGVPDAIAAPNRMPANFFNANSKRGVVFFTPGSGFEISAKTGNPTATPVEFGDISPNLPNVFQTFSPQRLFTALDSTVTEVLFFLPGTNIPATVNGFGSVFTGVKRDGSTRIEYFDVNGALLRSQDVPKQPWYLPGVSFAGTTFTAGERVYLVRITSGSVELSSDGGIVPRSRRGEPVDVVVMDDFIYAEPQTLELE